MSSEARTELGETFLAPVVLSDGFDFLLLDGMYSQPPNGATMGFLDDVGSASSVALPKVTPMVALPVPPRASGGGEVAGGDPFASSVWPLATFLPRVAAQGKS
ncbi:uncharacterized protein A4U43_C07F2860 [Asparagus officinalis]|uniref:Uncharacterized protein n=1 Tax=Asparagus officinalis TaxID=4686 RepID=A0A5P1E904_ASPOF|nr:uncharacterized protein A4U43_C07F2860 [Asparagus officinalis]